MVFRKWRYNLKQPRKIKLLLQAVLHSQIQGVSRWFAPIYFNNAKNTQTIQVCLILKVTEVEETKTVTK